MNEKITNYIHDHVPSTFAIALCVLIVSAFLLGREFGLHEPKHNDVNGTIQQAKQTADEAGASIGEAKMENESIRNSVDRASATLREVRERADRSQANLREANKLIDECLEQNRTAQNGLKDIRNSNR